ncbi:MAG: DUF1553 domain-containing protein, partial [Verrucomicrobiota bacterium]
ESGRRESTTVPTQALFMLNSAFVTRESLSFARRLLAAKDESDTQKIKQAYQLTLNRPPTGREISRAKKFIAQYESAYLQSPPVEVAEDQPPVMATAGPTDGNAKPVDSKVKPADVNPDDIDTSDVAVVEVVAQPKNAPEAAWTGFIQSLYASAEFRFVR